MIATTQSLKVLQNSHLHKAMKVEATLALKDKPYQRRGILTDNALPFVILCIMPPMETFNNLSLLSSHKHPAPGSKRDYKLHLETHWYVGALDTLSELSCFLEDIPLPNQVTSSVTPFQN